MREAFKSVNDIDRVLEDEDGNIDEEIEGIIDNMLLEREEKKGEEADIIIRETLNERDSSQIAVIVFNKLHTFEVEGVETVEILV